MAIKDFDAYLSERRQKSTNGFILFGKEYLLPPTMPFDAVLMFKEMQDRGEDTKLEYEDIVPVMEAIVGKDVFDEIRSHHEFDMDLMLNVLKYVMDAYNKIEGNSDPKAQTVKRVKGSQ